MEALSLVVNSKLVGDDVRHSTSGYDEVRLIADEALRVQPRRHRAWSALWHTITRTEEVVKAPRLVAQSSGD
jgi:hypothetical protein